LKKRNLQRVVTLSAVGTGAAFLTADQAEAGTIWYSGTENLQVGWSASPGAASHQTIQLGSASLVFARASGNSSSRGYRSIRFRGQRASVLGQYYGMQVFGNGSAFPAAFSLNPKGMVGGRTWTTAGTFHATFGNQPFTDSYALFTITPSSGPNPLYGWVELSYSVTAGRDSSAANGPLLTIEGWAYDTSGNRIVAGDTGSSATPEPDTFASTGLAALALGAAGMRRWRKKALSGVLTDPGQ